MGKGLKTIIALVFATLGPSFSDSFSWARESQENASNSEANLISFISEGPDAAPMTQLENLKGVLGDTCREGDENINVECAHVKAKRETRSGALSNSNSSFASPPPQALLEPPTPLGSRVNKPRQPAAQ